jgi:hypothetical protein
MMKIKQLGQLREKSSIVFQVGENQIQIDGTIYNFPTSIEVFTPIDGIIKDAHRDATGELFVTAVVGYSIDYREEFESSK